MPYEHVLTVYDGTMQSEEVLEMVCRIVRPHRARLSILIVKLIPLAEELPGYRSGADPQVDELVKRAEKFASSRKVNAATTVRYARALGPTVVSESRLHGTDLVALAVPDIEMLPSDRVWHTDLRTILRQATCAVMLCRPGRGSGVRQGPGRGNS